MFYAPVSLIMQFLGFLHVTACGSASIALISSTCSSLLRSISTQNLQQKIGKCPLPEQGRDVTFFSFVYRASDEANKFVKEISWTK